jgi:hypothetical protein
MKESDEMMMKIHLEIEDILSSHRYKNLQKLYIFFLATT